MPDKVYLKWQFYHINHHRLNLRHPQTYADKLAWMKLYDKNPQLTNLVDKYEVRKFVEEKIGSQYLIPLIGVYNSVEEIPWNDLPQKYVLKCTHDSASVILHCDDKPFDKENAILSLEKHMKRNMYWYSREYPYRDVKPRIVCEEFLDDHGHSPADYKVLCFNGKPEYIVVDQDRFTNHRRDLYNAMWIKQDFSSDHEQSNVGVERPEKLEEMLQLATILSQGFKHVRVDFYSLNDKVYFGELTFFPWGGPIWFKPDKWNYILGELINLGEKNG